MSLREVTSRTGVVLASSLSDDPVTESLPATVVRDERDILW